MKTWQVGKEASGFKLMAFLREKLGPSYSLRDLKAAMAQNRCFLNGHVERFGSRLVGWGDQIQFDVEVPLQPLLSKLDPLTILYEDEDFLFIDKPIGICSDDPWLISQLKASLAHRLDKETSGVLAWSKTTRAQQALFHLFKSRKVNKQYYAWVQGIPKKDIGVIESPLKKCVTYQGQNLWRIAEKGTGLSAFTEWELVKKEGENALLRCFPKTGRTHQIRVHLASIGHPILGDKLYGQKAASRCMLHAAQLTFMHPFKNVKLSVEAKLPQGF